MCSVTGAACPAPRAAAAFFSSDAKPEAAAWWLSPAPAGAAVRPCAGCRRCRQGGQQVGCAAAHVLGAVFLQLLGSGRLRRRVRALGQRGDEAVAVAGGSWPHTDCTSVQGPHRVQCGARPAERRGAARCCPAATGCRHRPAPAPRPHTQSSLKLASQRPRSPSTGWMNSRMATLWRPSCSRPGGASALACSCWLSMPRSTSACKRGSSIARAWLPQPRPVGAGRSAAFGCGLAGAGVDSVCAGAISPPACTRPASLPGAAAGRTHREGLAACLGGGGFPGRLPHAPGAESGPRHRANLPVAAGPTGGWCPTRAGLAAAWASRWVGLAVCIACQGHQPSGGLGPGGGRPLARPVRTRPSSGCSVLPSHSPNTVMAAPV